VGVGEVDRSVLSPVRAVDATVCASKELVGGASKLFIEARRPQLRQREQDPKRVGKRGASGARGRGRRGVRGEDESVAGSVARSTRRGQAPYFPGRVARLCASAGAFTPRPLRAPVVPSGAGSSLSSHRPRGPPARSGFAVSLGIHCGIAWRSGASRQLCFVTASGVVWLLSVSAAYTRCRPCWAADAIRLTDFHVSQTQPRWRDDKRPSSLRASCR